MRAKRAVLGVVAVVAVVGGAALAWGVLAGPWAERPRAAAPSQEFPGGRPIDAASIASGKLALERMPEEITGALEVQSAEIVKTAQALEGKQARITGVCAPGSAIRLVGEDGTVTCQKLPRGIASVAALAGTPRSSKTGTAQGSVPGAVGRYQTSGEDDWLVVPIELPDGAIVTKLTYVYWDTDPKVDGTAYLYRTDDTVLAGVVSEGVGEEVRLVETMDVKNARIDNAAYGYFVYLQLSAAAGPALMPIAASVTYRLP